MSLVVLGVGVGIDWVLRRNRSHVWVGWGKGGGFSPLSFPDLKVLIQSSIITEPYMIYDILQFAGLHTTPPGDGVYIRR